MPFVFMRRGFRRRAMRSMPLQHADVDAVLEAEPDPDEAELVRFEQHCKLLETHRYKGVEWLQVQLWLIFEDASSSLTAKVVQASILVLIIFSTLLILVQSFNECKWIDDAQVDGIPFADLAPCRFESNHSQPGIPSCTRVCEERKEPLDQGGPVHYFVMDAICIGCFTIEFLLRLLSSPATIGLGAFLSSVPNWIDVVAIVPFYIDIIVLLAAPGAAAGGGRVLAVLRIVRLTRVLRVLKFSKSLSGIVVLVRTVAQSGSAMALIATFTILNCVLWASLMMATPEVGKWEQGVNISGGEYLRVDGTNSPFARTMEGWWWCLQTLTSVGYGVPYAPMEELGKITSMITALVGTVVLALPIAVVGLTFDDEWNKQAKVNNFQVPLCRRAHQATDPAGPSSAPRLPAPPPDCPGTLARPCLPPPPAPHAFAPASRPPPVSRSHASMSTTRPRSTARGASQRRRPGCSTGSRSGGRASSPTASRPTMVRRRRIRKRTTSTASATSRRSARRSRSTARDSPRARTSRTRRTTYRRTCRRFSTRTLTRSGARRRRSSTSRRRKCAARWPPTSRRPSATTSSPRKVRARPRATRLDALPPAARAARCPSRPHRAHPRPSPPPLSFSFG